LDRIRQLPCYGGVDVIRKASSGAAGGFEGSGGGYGAFTGQAGGGAGGPGGSQSLITNGSAGLTGLLRITYF
jgi:hypothetical protein